MIKTIEIVLKIWGTTKIDWIEDIYGNYTTIEGLNKQCDAIVGKYGDIRVGIPDGCGNVVLVGLLVEK